MAGGQTALALRLLLALFSSKISSDVNRPFGDEVMDTGKNILATMQCQKLEFCVFNLRNCYIICSSVLLEK